MKLKGFKRALKDLKNLEFLKQEEEKVSNEDRKLAEKDNKKLEELKNEVFQCLKNERETQEINQV